jgi:Putative transposase
VVHFAPAGLPGPDGLVRIALKKPFSDVAVDLDPLSLLCRLVALVPAPRFHTVRYSGVLAPAAKWRPLVVPKPPPPATTQEASSSAPCETSPIRTQSALAIAPGLSSCKPLMRGVMAGAKRATTGALGVCSRGTLQCRNGAFTCEVPILGGAPPRSHRGGSGSRYKSSTSSATPTPSPTLWPAVTTRRDHGASGSARAQISTSCRTWDTMTYSLSDGMRR